MDKDNHMASPLDEFNAYASVPEELARRLMYHIMSGSSAILAAQLGAPATERREAEERKKQDERRFAAASEEQRRKVQDEISRLDEASYGAFVKNEEQLKVARKRLEELRSEAREVAFPDGSWRKVYRDGEVVRDDDGAVVAAELARPEEVSARRSQWSERKAAGEAVDLLESEQKQLLDHREDIARVQERLDGGDSLEEDQAAMEALKRNMPAAAQRELDRFSAEPESRVHVRRGSARR